MQTNITGQSQYFVKSNASQKDVKLHPRNFPTMTYNFSYIIDTLTCAAYQMPEKMTIYSTLVGWLNSQDDKFGEEFVKYVLEQLNDMLLSSRWEAARYTVRFISGKLIKNTD